MTLRSKGEDPQFLRVIKQREIKVQSSASRTGVVRHLSPKHRQAMEGHFIDCFSGMKTRRRSEAPKNLCGSHAGRIIQGSNRRDQQPRLLLDEVDKIGMIQGIRRPRSSSSRPGAERRLHDHYLNVPFDLSRVMFITTANQVDTIPPALRDRMRLLPCGLHTERKTLIAKLT
jgi:hypothetical protein